MLLLIAWPVWSEEYPPQKVVYHLNEASKIMEVLRNVQNHIKAVGEDKLDIIVVTHGTGYEMFLKDKTNDEIMSKVKALQKQGVKFHQCKFTLQQKKLSLKDMVILMEADLVLSGVAEVIRLQQNGYHYIKP
jgi:intracellular sulfur oxidation DsrE/DsrF family protein